MGVLIGVIGFDIGLVSTVRGVLCPYDQKVYYTADSLEEYNADDAFEGCQIADELDVI